jgi:hypothetical protein
MMAELKAQSAARTAENSPAVYCWESGENQAKPVKRAIEVVKPGAIATGS